LIPESVECENADDDSKIDPNRSPSDDANREARDRTVRNIAHPGRYSLLDKSADLGTTFEAVRELVREHCDVNRKVQLKPTIDESAMNG
jgi:hypothetical protein